MAMAAKYKGEDDRKSVAVIGDGALTAGLAFEGLNHAGVSDADVLIIHSEYLSPVIRCIFISTSAY